MVAKKKSNCVPPKVVKRNTHGLIEDVNYVFNEDGLINWRKMVDEKHLVPNRQYTTETDVSKLRDNQLLILLGGTKELAQIRGYTSVEYDTVSPSSDYVVATCKITWIPNYETENNEVTFSAIGDAAPHNTDNFAKNFLGPIAENRAFVRCVRNFLKIHIVSKEEMAGTPSTTRASTLNSAENLEVSDPKLLLSKLMKDKNINFNQIKSKLEKENYPNADTFSSVSDIPNIKIFELLDRIQKIKT